MYIFVVAMCGGFDADLRYDFALLPLYGVRLVTYVSCFCLGWVAIVLIERNGSKCSLLRMFST